MSSRRNTEVAQGLLAFLRDQLGLGKVPASEIGKGFAWKFEGVVQRVWIEDERRRATLPGPWITAATDVLKSGPHGSAAAAAVNLLNANTALNAYVWNWDSGVISLRCSIPIREEFADWSVHLLFHAVVLQVTQAEDLAAERGRLGGELADSPRTDLPMLAGTTDIAAALRDEMAQVSWVPSDDEIASEFEAEPLFAKEISRISQGVVNALLSNSMGEPMGMLSAWTTQVHPKVGPGILLRTLIPLRVPPDHLAPIAAGLTSAEVANRPVKGETSSPYLFGGWCCDRQVNGVSFVTFIPSTLFRKGLLHELCLSAVHRCRWANNTLLDGLISLAPKVVEADDYIAAWKKKKKKKKE